MLTAISRYGARVIPNTLETIAALRERGELVQGPHLASFERAFGQRVDARHAVGTSFGRMAFFYILKALDLPPGSEIIFPALTFWVIPELARVAGHQPVFVDVDPKTFTLDPEACARAITPRTRAIVPTHLYGLPCDMEPILQLARQHGLKVIEDCAHALGATWRGQPVGTIGDAGFFSFQLLKPLNAYGGGMAVTNNAVLAAAVRTLAEAAPSPERTAVERRLRIGQIQRIAIRPRVFTYSLFPILWASSYLHTSPDVYLWEKQRPLAPLPAHYTERLSNVQAAIGLQALTHLDTWTTKTIWNAVTMTNGLTDAAVDTPLVPANRTHVFYQYAIYTKDRDAVVRRCIRHGVDVEILHVDVCTRLPLFGRAHAPTPGAERAAAAIQLPVHASMAPADLQRVARVVRRAVVT